jgi:hypothetical protein
VEVGLHLASGAADRQNGWILRHRFHNHHHRIQTHHRMWLSRHQKEADGDMTQLTAGFMFRQRVGRRRNVAKGKGR